MLRILKKGGIKYVPIVIGSDEKGVFSYTVQTSGADTSSKVKTFLWNYPEMITFGETINDNATELADESYSYMNDGRIKLSGSLGSEASGDATIIIVPAECDMLNGDGWKSAEPEYVDVQTLSIDGKYEFDILLEKEGKFTALYRQPKIFQSLFV